jgi:hypothetical protein
MRFALLQEIAGVFRVAVSSSNRVAGVTAASRYFFGVLYMGVFSRLAAAALIFAAGASTTAATPARGPMAALSIARSASVRRPHLPPGPPVPRVRISLADRIRAASTGWQRVAAAPPFASAGLALLMTDGSVLVHDNGSNWYALQPDSNGNYVNGTWTQKAPLPAGYAPLYFASAVLPDGRVIVNGGEYNYGAEVWTNLGAIYSPTLNRWTSVAPPPGWSTIGDAPSTVLASGTYMLGNCCSATQALFNAATNAWAIVGAGKVDSNNEEGWTLLPNGHVLTADVGAAGNSEIFSPSIEQWTPGGSLPVKLVSDDEIGPQILRQNGHVFVAGANGQTAIYNQSIHQWTAGPAMPFVGGRQLDVADGPAVLLGNGDVIMPASPGLYQSPSYFVDFSADGKSLSTIPGPPNALNDSSYNYKLLLLPTGQVLETDFSNDVEIYTPPAAPNAAIAPVISSVPTTLTHGATYTAYGVRFNGVSQASAYGDDAQAATNYPLVAIVNAATAHVFFARTHNFSSMAVASGATVSTAFDVPSSIEFGAAKLVVIANGIQSRPVPVTVR